VDTRHMVFGIQASGKTTFAAALWHLVDSEEVPTALLKGKHAGNFSYLEEVAQSWCEGWEVERTKSQQIENVRINLRHAPSNGEVALEFDDLSGETFEQAFATRLCTKEFLELVKAAEGILLFLSASRKIDGVTILDAFDAEETPSEPDEAEEAEWDPYTAPLQVQLVDLLQSLLRPPFEKPPLKIALIVSAWDLTDESDATRWLEKRYPLLAQYLQSSEGVANARIYGVSAQGGRLSKRGHPPGQDRDRLLMMTPPSKRIKIIGPDVAEHDLTRPLLWLAGLEPPT
jgi:hypothetical protein